MCAWLPRFFDSRLHYPLDFLSRSANLVVATVAPPCLALNLSSEEWICSRQVAGSGSPISPQYTTYGQDFYREYLVQDDFMVERMKTLARRAGLSEERIQRALSEKKVLLTSFCLQVFVFHPHQSCQVPVDFTFIDLDPKKGLTESMVTHQSC